ncbi:MAG: hypothetical protein EOO75_17390 [Myxococcales bacterium]|nr:MAG: hypothetical protein EOO75_17390 [Myxococcales bacterium]
MSPSRTADTRTKAASRPRPCQLARPWPGAAVSRSLQSRWLTSSTCAGPLTTRRSASSSTGAIAASIAASARGSERSAAHTRYQSAACSGVGVSPSRPRSASQTARCSASRGTPGQASWPIDQLAVVVIARMACVVRRPPASFLPHDRSGHRP